MSKNTRARGPELKRLCEDRAYKLHLQNKTTAEIAAELDVSHRQANRYLAAAELRAKEELRDLSGRAGVARQFMVLLYVQNESISAWERSKEPRLKTQTAMQDGEGGGTKCSACDGKGSDPLEKKTCAVCSGTGMKPSGSRRLKKAIKTIETKIGDKVFLDVILKANERVCDLLGLDAAKVKLLLNDALANDGDLTLDELRKLPAGELLRRYLGEAATPKASS